MVAKDETYQHLFWNKGKVSNALSFTLLLVGLTATLQGAEPDAYLPPLVLSAAPWLLTAGLFGFAGGITNWLAVKMLFDRVPLLYGSGVIPNRFREIREKVKSLIMTHFFDEVYLERFFTEHGALLGGDLKEKLRDLLTSEEAEEAIEAELERLQQGPFGMMLKMAGTDILKTMVKDFMEGLIDRLGPAMEEKLRGEVLNIPALRGQVDKLLEVKLEELSPEVVKQMMEQVMREHLGWLIVWGNLFGGAIGLVSLALALYWNMPGVP
ncbi:MAG: DUF445 family protein [Candidatus Latescibacterota bacterium]|nr:DUF445 family protein [Candidatus Latescibacterota bacterium]